MDNELTLLLENLSKELGTTTEYLWGILINQAKVHAVKEFVFIGVTFLVGLFMYKLHVRFSKNNINGNSLYYDYNELIAIPMIIGAFAFAVLFIVSIVSIGGIIDALYNPEYWALNRVLDKI